MERQDEQDRDVNVGWIACNPSIRRLSGGAGRIDEQSILQARDFKLWLPILIYEYL